MRCHSVFFKNFFLKAMLTRIIRGVSAYQVSSVSGTLELMISESTHAWFSKEKLCMHIEYAIDRRRQFSKKSIAIGENMPCMVCLMIIDLVIKINYFSYFANNHESVMIYDCVHTISKQLFLMRFVILASFLRHDSNWKRF